MDVNTYATMTLEKSEDMAYMREIQESIEKKTADRREVLDKLEKLASENGSDNAWNRYESADEAYGYAEELSILISEYLDGDEEWETIEWQLSDLVKNTGNEFMYRLERAQW